MVFLRRERREIEYAEKYWGGGLGLQPFVEASTRKKRLPGQVKEQNKVKRCGQEGEEMTTVLVPIVEASSCWGERLARENTEVLR